MSTLIVDASVVGALVFGEPRAEEAVALLSGRHLVAPSLLSYEVGNIARTKAVRRPDSRALLEEAVGAFLRLPITLAQPDHRRTLGLALESGITYYDAAYLQLALELAAPLATFDARLAEASHRAGCGVAGD